ncbi:TetR/AcrR family transcriptional regulator [Rhodothermus profundi]|uniref:Transcriptional regulator, TetR family n=1 Tax=Rhodothermus profundi TaxID=633813 RepID=A0A1M6QK53_9BACT|nr:TetR/AcrR family transcriptional regulator [Rhodothermus profundi]SHK20654.1 transcriptional regulator, TetR family [Rhodothermus profundi]
MESPSLSRKERERLMRRQAMLEAARAVFAEKGYVDATLDEIAQRAEFGKGTLYNYFPGGKDELFFAVFEEVFAQFRQLIETSFADAASFREGFEAFLRASFEFFEQNRDMLLLVTRESQRMMVSPDPERAAFFQRHHDAFLQLLTRHIQAAIERGEVRPLPAEAVAHTILGNLHGLAMHRLLKECVTGKPQHALPTPEEATRFLSTLLLEGLLDRRKSQEES